MGNSILPVNTTELKNIVIEGATIHGDVVYVDTWIFNQ